MKSTEMWSRRQSESKGNDPKIVEIQAHPLVIMIGLDLKNRVDYKQTKTK
jgi:hypothetical protein